MQRIRKRPPSRTYVSVINIRHFRNEAKTGNQNLKKWFFRIKVWNEIFKKIGINHTRNKKAKRYLI